MVAGWPHPQWVAWRRRVDKLIAEGADADEIQAADRRAYEELTRPDPFAGRASR